jgi:hypothetical protein
MSKIFSHILSQYSWKFLAVMSALVLILSIANNLIQPQDRKVAWIGGQEVLAKPAPEGAE